MDAKTSAIHIIQVKTAVHRLALTADVGTLGEYGALLAGDVVWEQTTDGVLPAQVRRGRADAVAGARERRELGVQGPGTQTRHVVTNTVVTPGEDYDRAVSYWHFFQGMDAAPLLRACGVYSDLFTRTATGHWQLQHRQIHRALDRVRLP